MCFFPVTSFLEHTTQEIISPEKCVYIPNVHQLTRSYTNVQTFNSSNASMFVLLFKKKKRTNNSNAIGKILKKYISIFFIKKKNIYKKKKILSITL